MLYTGLAILLSVPLTVLVLLVGLHYYLRWRYLHFIQRIFEELPLFVIPRGLPVDNAEEVHFPTTDGLTLRGCYLRTPQAKRRGVILFGLEFGSSRWACVPYCERLLENGYDVFSFEPRGQGDSPLQPGYEPLQWVTDYEVADVRAALTYLKARSDADPRGVGLFGISKGGAAGLIAASQDPCIRCFATDGIFATYTTMLPYMRKWYGIYNNHYNIQQILPLWYYGILGMVALRKIARTRQCRFPHLENVIPKLAPRPWLMIHGGGDTYIRAEMAQKLFDRAGQPKECWIVEGAKHNQALHLARDEYQGRVLEFFNKHLAEPPLPTSAGAAETSPAPAEQPALVETTP